VGWWLRLLGIWRLPEKPKREKKPRESKLVQLRPFPLLKAAAHSTFTCKPPLGSLLLFQQPKKPSYQYTDEVYVNPGLLLLRLLLPSFASSIGEHQHTC